MTTTLWEGPIGFEGVSTGDNRYIEVGALVWGTLPAPIRYAAKDVGAHDGAEVAGRITAIERRDTEDPNVKVIWGSGDFDSKGDVGLEAARHVGENLTNGISMDLDDVSFEVREQALSSGKLGEMMVTTGARVRAATIVAIPAFEGARIELAKQDGPSDLFARVEAARQKTVAVDDVTAIEPTDAAVLAQGTADEASEFAYSPLEWINPSSGDKLELPSNLLAQMGGVLASYGDHLKGDREKALKAIDKAGAHSSSVSDKKLAFSEVFRDIEKHVADYETALRESDENVGFKAMLDLSFDSVVANRAVRAAVSSLLDSEDVDSSLRRALDDLDKLTGCLQKTSQALQDWELFSFLINSVNGQPAPALAVSPREDDEDDYAAAVETFKKNWVDKVGGLPRYIKEVAKGIGKSNPGWSESRRIATAVNTIKRWARGGGDVTAKTRAKAAAALAEWEAKKAAAKASAVVSEAFSSTAYERESIFVTATLAAAKALGWTKDSDGPAGLAFKNSDGWKILITTAGLGANKFALFNADGDQYGYMNTFVEAAYHALEIDQLHEDDEKFLAERQMLIEDEPKQFWGDEDVPTESDEEMATEMLAKFSLNDAAAEQFAKQTNIVIVFDQAGNILGVVEPDAIQAVEQPGKAAPAAPAAAPAEPAAAPAAAPAAVPTLSNAERQAFADKAVAAGEGATMAVYDKEGNLVGIVDIENVKPLTTAAPANTVTPTAAAATTETLATDDVLGNGKTFTETVLDKFDELQEQGESGETEEERLEREESELLEEEEEKAIAAQVNYEPEQRSLVASGVATLAAPIAPPESWFFEPEHDGPTPMTITPEGKVYGHLATWDVCHLAMPNGVNECVTAPRSDSDYSMFHLGTVRTAEGKDVSVGRISMNTGHAGDNWNPRRALAHYENTGMAAADVHAINGEHGIWFSGALRPDATPTQIRALRASPLSGDWRRNPATGSMELVMALAVNQPGFAVPHPKGLVASGALQSLVAAGMIPPAQVKRPGTRGALSLEDLGYLRRLANRERASEGSQLRARALAATAKIKVGAFAAKRAADTRKEH
jgi:hypothetical protein